MEMQNGYQPDDADETLDDSTSLQDQESEEGADYTDDETLLDEDDDPLDDETLDEDEDTNDVLDDSISEDLDDDDDEKGTL